MPLTTLSQLERVEACPGSTTLPQVKRSNPNAGTGTKIHAYLRDARTIGRDAALARVADDVRALCACIDLDGLPPGDFGAEIVLAIAPGRRAARVFGESKEHRRYDVADDEIPGTIDVAGDDAAGDCAYAGDYKAGFRGRFIKVRESLQILTAAVALALAKGRSRAIVDRIWISPDGEVFTDRATIDVFDFEIILSRLVALQRAEVEAKRLLVPEVNEGDHCEYCPAFDSCPAKQGLMRALVADPSATLEEPVRATLTPNNPAAAVAAWGLLERASEVLKRARSVLYGYAAQHPITLPDGQVLGKYGWAEQVFDGRATYDVMREWFGEELALRTVTLETSAAAIERSMREVVVAHGRDTKPPKLAPLTRFVEAKVRGAGGVTVKLSERLGLHWPKERPPTSELRPLKGPIPSEDEVRSLMATPASRWTIDPGDTRPLAEKCEGDYCLGEPTVTVVTGETAPAIAMGEPGAVILPAGDAVRTDPPAFACAGCGAAFGAQEAHGRHVQAEVALAEWDAMTAAPEPLASVEGSIVVLRSAPSPGVEQEVTRPIRGGQREDVAEALQRAGVRPEQAKALAAELPPPNAAPDFASPEWADCPRWARPGAAIQRKGQAGRFQIGGWPVRQVSESGSHRWGAYVAGIGFQRLDDFEPYDGPPTLMDHLRT